jgi:two-component system, NtrC family, response regulator HydG
MNTILIIDDDLDICALLERYLSKNDFNVAIAYSGRAALQYLAKNTPDVILSDFRLEDMLGTELLKEIKKKDLSAPVIIMTGYSDVKTAVNIM